MNRGDRWCWSLSPLPGDMQKSEISVWQAVKRLFWRRISVLTFKTRGWQHLPKASVSERGDHTVRLCTASLRFLNRSFSGLTPLVAIGKMRNEREERFALLIALFPFPSSPAPLFHWGKPGRTAKGLEIKWKQKENGTNFFLHLLWNFEC